MAIESAQPLRLLVRAGSIAFNFPAGTDFVIVTPQLEIRPGPDLEAVSGVIAALPEDDQDIVQTRNGLLDVLERQEHGALRRVEGGQLLVASLVPTFSIPVAEPSFALPQAQTQIAQFQAVEGDVFLTRFQTTLRNRVDAPGVPLFSGDEVTTLQGKADVLFTDQSLITLDVGTTVVIEEQQQPTGILRSISQGLGSLWFNIQQVVGTETELTTPTAVAAIRGTEGSQFVPNATQSTHSLNEGVEDITELITGQTVTITDGQIVTAIRGVGFTPIAALLALIPKPGVGVGGGGGGAAGGGAGGGAAGAAAGAATSTVSSVATVAAASVAAGAVATATVVPLATRNEPQASPTNPLSFPGGDIATTVPLEIRSEARPASPSRPDSFPGPEDFPGRGRDGFPGIGDFPGGENFRGNSRGRGNARR